jgi:hypothetical protein
MADEAPGVSTGDHARSPGGLLAWWRNDTPEDDDLSEGVVGNSRLTGLVAAVLLVVLAAEGVTILGVRQMLEIHVFIGMMLVPLVGLKVASTSYRIGRYYRGDPSYRHKGPPPIVLRVIGPLVGLTSIVVLATGITALLIGQDAGHQWVQIHKISFFAWLALMAVHVLGHLRETPQLAFADWRQGVARRVRGVRLRLVSVGLAVAVGIGLGLIGIGWASSWPGNDFGRFGH